MVEVGVLLEMMHSSLAASYHQIELQNDIKKKGS
jgi:hypothetical protein